MTDKCVFFEEPLEDSLFVNNSKNTILNGEYVIVGKPGLRPIDTYRLPEAIFGFTNLKLNITKFHKNLNKKIDDLELKLQLNRTDKAAVSTIKRELDGLIEQREELEQTDKYHQKLLEDNQEIYSTKSIYYKEEKDLFLVRRNNYRASLSAESWVIIDFFNNILAKCDGRGNWTTFNFKYNTIEGKVEPKKIKGNGYCQATRIPEPNLGAYYIDTDVIVYPCVKLSGFKNSKINGTYKKNDIQRRLEFNFQEKDTYSKGNINIEQRYHKGRLFWVIYEGETYFSPYLSNVLAMFECKDTSNRCAKIINKKRKQPKYQVDYDDLYCSILNNPRQKWKSLDLVPFKDSIVICDSKHKSRLGNSCRKKTLKRPSSLKFTKRSNKTVDRPFEYRTLKEMSGLLSPIAESPRKSVSPRRRRSSTNRRRTRRRSSSNHRRVLRTGSN